MRTTAKIASLFVTVAAASAVGTTMVLAQASPEPVAERTATSAAPAEATSAASESTATNAQPTAETSTAVTPAAIASRGDRGERVSRVQTWLWRLGLLPVKPTGFYGAMTESAVRDFQMGQNLPVTGVVDEATWRGLEKVADDLPDPKVETPEPTEQPTPTTEPTRRPTPEVSNTHQLDSRCLTGRVICIDKSKRRMYWVVDGQVIDDWSVRTGRAGMRTREGTFAVYLKSENHWSTLYHVRMPYALFFDGGQAVHYSSDFANNGYGVGSHGCVNMRDRAGAKWLFDQARIGDKVVVHS